MARRSSTVPPVAPAGLFHAVEDRLCIVYPAGHPIGRRRRIGIEHFLELPLVLTDPATSVRMLVDAAFLARGRRPKMACETTYMMTAVAMVRAGLGLTILPASAREVHAEPGLAAKAIDDPAFVRRVAIVKKKNRTLPPAAEDFLAHCKTAARVM